MNAPDTCGKAGQMVETGAVLTFPLCPPQHHLIGHLHFIDGSRLFWFAAFGDTAADGHVLDFDRVEASERGICFATGSGLKAVLEPIDQAPVDQEDYRVAWTLWQQVLPMRRRFIDRVLETLIGQAGSDSADPANAG